MASKLSTKVLTLDAAISEVIKFRTDSLRLFTRLSHAADRADTVWLFCNRPVTIPFDFEAGMYFSGSVFDYDFYHSQHGNPVPDPASQAQPHCIETLNTVSDDREHIEWAIWEGLLNNLEAACLGQSKERARGIWRGPGQSPNRMRIRVPHK